MEDSLLRNQISLDGNLLFEYLHLQDQKMLLRVFNLALSEHDEYIFYQAKILLHVFYY